MLPSTDYDRHLDALIDAHTRSDEELATDADYAVWCDEHRDAWIADLDATTDTDH
jgi:hypothetical protein